MVEPPRCHSKLSCKAVRPDSPSSKVVRGHIRPESPSSKVVQGISAWSNHPELTRNCPVGLTPLAAKWFEEVRCGRTTPVSLETVL